MKTNADPPRSRHQESSLRETSRGNLRRKQEEVGRAFRPQCFMAFEKRGKERKIGWKHPDCRSKKVEVQQGQWRVLKIQRLLREHSFFQIHICCGIPASLSHWLGAAHGSVALWYCDLWEEICTWSLYHFWHVCSCPFSYVWLFVTCMDYSLPGSSVHGILQARILEWAARISSMGCRAPKSLGIF